MCNTIGGLSGAKDIGLLDCVTYISGLSGECPEFHEFRPYQLIFYDRKLLGPRHPLLGALRLSSRS
jgi:hypothetical protein